MAEVAGTIRSKCAACGANITPIAEHRPVTVKLNGPGGQFPTVTVVKGDLIRAAFAKNAGNFAEVANAYRMPNIDPQPGNQFIAYVRLEIREEPIPQE